MPVVAPAVKPSPAGSGSPRKMWLDPDRVFYAGLLGEPSERTLGALAIYVALDGPMRVQIDGGPWQPLAVAVVRPHTPHRVSCEGRLIGVVLIEPESVDMARLPACLLGGGACVDGAPPAELAPLAALADRVRALHAQPTLDLTASGLDTWLFGSPLPPRQLDPRVARALTHLKQHPADALSAQDCAAMAQLSPSRFLHLFKDEVGTSFRSLRTWKRARSLLHYVSRPANLAHVALEAGYPDSTHFSHSIRQVYGLKPRDIFAGSRRLTVQVQEAAACGH